MKKAQKSAFLFWWMKNISYLCKVKWIKMRFYVVTIVLFMASLSVFSATPTAKESESSFVVVIDAGHGGTDPGAIGQIAQEKDLNLAVALLAGDLIRKQYPEVKVLYTRETDVFIPLQKRADFANKNNANLFISIHTNASPASSAKGAETFVLGTDRLDKNLDVAMRENAVIKLEADYQTTYHGFDPNSVDSYIMFELMQNQYLDQSLNYATYLQQGFANVLKRGDRGVRQAAFWVLLKSACPSVLIEMGFISNLEEERFLASAAGQKEIAKNICDAFSSFYRKVSGLKVDTSLPPEQSEQPTQAESVRPTSVSSQPEQEQPQVPVQPVQPDAPSFAVQIFASHQIVPANDPQFKGLTGCKYIQKGDWYKYYYGETNDREQAGRLQQQLKAKFPDCFVIKLQ